MKNRRQANSQRGPPCVEYNPQRRSARLKSLYQCKELEGSHSRRTSNPHLKRRKSDSQIDNRRPAKRSCIDRRIDPTAWWVRTGKRPSLHDYSQTEQEMEQLSAIVTYAEIDGFRYPRPITKFEASLRRKQSDSTLNSASSDQKKSDTKNIYRDNRYDTLLAAKGCFMEDFSQSPTDTSIHEYGLLLASPQTVPSGTIFGDNVYQTTCRRIRQRNEAMVFHTITSYVVPSVGDLATFGATELDNLAESINEAWSASIPIEGPRPQPDYCVGFKQSAFSKQQLEKLSPLIGGALNTSFFAATHRMWFPFLTCEVKCGATALDIADRQNQHSMCIAVRGLVELYRAVKREKELHRQILAFSISHDDRGARIYGHYPVINDQKTAFYRRDVKEFLFTGGDGKDRWIAYKFVKSLYEIWMPIHLARLCSAIDQIPSGLDFDVFQNSKPLSTEISFPLGELSTDGDQPGNQQVPTPNASTSQGQSKKARIQKKK